MPAAMTAKEVDLLRATDAAMDNFEKAQTARNATGLAKARANLERIRGELERIRNPHADALAAIQKSLGQPIDPATGRVIAKAASRPLVIDHRRGRTDNKFDKLSRPGALAK
jgi:hypothetical protein